MRLKTIGVVGAGTAGKSIIRSLAGSGMDVVFCEIDEQKVEDALREISESLDQEIARWGVTANEKRLILSRVKGTTDMRDMAGAQVVIEVTPGDIEEKQLLFESMDNLFPPDTVLVSNSATLCISDVAKRAAHPDRIVGMHFCLPVPRRPIVEIVQGQDTSERSMETVRLLAKILKKTVLEVFEMPGLVTTRIMIPYINEAIHIVMEGLADPEQVDEAIRLGFSLPIGPLAMADQIGLDILLEDMGRLYKAFGTLKYHPCPLLWRMVREGHLGVKTRRGFFLYDENGNRTGCPSPTF
ncbi:3-hydroxybutyryl-CoA dehydrogenase [Candidatus Sumerlaeota bacterium]|nr:3-hydroxybutyryl-CoA dehydrogenase [Candidatus Sumerlaeota bacterium]